MAGFDRLYFDSNHFDTDEIVSVPQSGGSKFKPEPVPEQIFPQLEPLSFNINVSMTGLKQKIFLTPATASIHKESKSRNILNAKVMRSLDAKTNFDGIVNHRISGASGFAHAIRKAVDVTHDLDSKVNFTTPIQNVRSILELSELMDVSDILEFIN